MTTQAHNPTAPTTHTGRIAMKPNSQTCMTLTAAALGLTLGLATQSALAGTFFVNNFADGTDAATGISTSTTYTHLIDINKDSDTAVINGVTFDNTLGAYTLTGPTADNSGNTFNAGNPGTGIEALFDNFRSGGDPDTLTLSGLTPGETYKLRIYVGKWRGPTFTMTFDDGAIDTEVTELDRGAGQTTPSAFEYTYSLEAGDTDLSVNVTPDSVNTFHWYAFTNEVVPEPSTLALLGLGGLLIARRRHD